jgi:hypothetical protein
MQQPHVQENIREDVLLIAKNLMAIEEFFHGTDNRWRAVDMRRLRVKFDAMYKLFCRDDLSEPWMRFVLESEIEKELRRFHCKETDQLITDTSKASLRIWYSKAEVYRLYLERYE